MASYTENLNLLKKDPVADGADTFNIETMLNENWDKIDKAKGEIDASLSNKVKKIISLGAIGLTEETASIEGIVNALNDGDLLLVPMTTVGTGTGLVPANYGTLCVHRRSSSYVMFEYQTLSDKWIGYYNAGTSSSKWSGWSKIATATSPQEYSLPLAEGFSVDVSATYCKTQDGIVILSGSVYKQNGFVVNDVIGTLPVGYRPTSVLTRPAVLATTAIAAVLRIGTDGSISVINFPDSGKTYLKFNVTFLASVN